jgi:hypothetical protein
LPLQGLGLQHLAIEKLAVTAPDRIHLHAQADEPPAGILGDVRDLNRFLLVVADCIGIADVVRSSPIRPGPRSMRLLNTINAHFASPAGLEPIPAPKPMC